MTTYEEIDTVIQKAIDVLGDKSSALRWMNHPIPSFNYQTPSFVMSEPNGPELVMNILGRIEHGVL